MAEAPKRVSDHVVQTLARAIADAKAGSMHAVAIIAVGPDGRPSVLFGGDGDLVLSINFGADMLKNTIMQQGSQPTMNSGLKLPGHAAGHG